MDGSRTFDTTVVALASEADDGRIDVDARVFSVREDAPHHVLHRGGRVNFEDVEGHVVDLFDCFYVAEAAYDPRYLDRSAEIIDVRMPKATIFPVEPSSKLMREASPPSSAASVRGSSATVATLFWPPTWPPPASTGARAARSAGSTRWTAHAPSTRPWR
jgi:hypothetical protein